MNKFRAKLTSLLLALVILFGFPLNTLAAVDYSYDANGNMVSDGQYCYNYSEANQVSKVEECTTGQTVAEYVYDYEGKRVAKKVFEGGVLQETVYFPSKEFETKKLADGSTQNTSYYYVNDEIVARRNPGGTLAFYHNDHLGSTSVLTDENGDLVEETTYYPYGEVKSGGTSSKYLYTGQEKDFETGLSYYGARYYNPHIYRFAQADSILTDVYDPQQLNRYAYARNNPLKYTDPSGHQIQPIISLLQQAMPAMYSLSTQISQFFTSEMIQLTSLQMAVDSQQPHDLEEIPMPIVIMPAPVPVYGPSLGITTKGISGNALMGTRNPLNQAKAAFGTYKHASTFKSGYAKELPIKDPLMDYGIKLDFAKQPWPQSKEIVDIKPNTPSGIKAGIATKVKYENYIMNLVGEYHPVKIEYYEPPSLNQLIPFLKNK